MTVDFLNSFKKDLKKLSDKKLKLKIKTTILQLEAVADLSQIKNLKKMKGKTANAYRIRIGEYRLGFFEENNTLILARFVKRNDIYKVFP